MLKILFYFKLRIMHKKEEQMFGQFMSVDSTNIQ